MLYEIVFILYASFVWYVFSRGVTLVISKNNLLFKDRIVLLCKSIMFSITFPFILITCPELLYNSELFIDDL